MTARPIPVLINAASGGAAAAGEALMAEIHTLFAARGIAAEPIAVAAAAFPAAVDVAAASADIVVIGGGDGTLGSAAQRLARPGAPALGVLPLGTRNHFAGDLGIPLALAGAVDVIAAGQVRAVDMADVNGAGFINNASIGLYPLLVRWRDRRSRRGWPKALANLPAAWEALTRARHHRLRLELRHEARTLVTPLLMVGNNTYGIERGTLGHRARLDEGVLSIYALADRSRAALFWVALRALLGGLNPKRDFVVVAGCEDMTVGSDSDRIAVALDGETRELKPPLAFHLRKRALRVVVPEA